MLNTGVRLGSGGETFPDRLESLESGTLSENIFLLDVQRLDSRVSRTRIMSCVHSSVTSSFLGWEQSKSILNLQRHSVWVYIYISNFKIFRILSVTLNASLMSEVSFGELSVSVFMLEFNDTSNVNFPYV